MNDNDKQPGSDNNGPNPWMKSLLIWVGILVALALFVTLIDNRSASPGATPIAYSAFLDRVEQGGVKDVNIAGEVVTGTFTDASKFRT